MTLKDACGNVIETITGDKAFDFEWKIEGTRTFTVECTLKRGEYTDVNTYIFFVCDEINPKADREAVRAFMKQYKR